TWVVSVLEEDTPSASEQGPIYDDSQNTCEEINDEVLDPFLQQEISHVGLHPQQRQLSDSTGTPTADSPTVHLNS
ncbi:hypothetical protein MKX03_022977, partial [Papaver bracteatum]